MITDTLTPDVQKGCIEYGGIIYVSTKKDAYDSNTSHIERMWYIVKCLVVRQIQEEGAKKTRETALNTQLSSAQADTSNKTQATNACASEEEAASGNTCLKTVDSVHAGKSLAESRDVKKSKGDARAEKAARTAEETNKRRQVDGIEQLSHVWVCMTKLGCSYSADLMRQVRSLRAGALLQTRGPI
jgi:hypothetical protein